MTNEEYGVIVLPIDILLRSSPLCKQLIYEVINAGYDIPRFKYGIIKSPRIRDVSLLFKDLGFDQYPGQSFLFLLVRDEILVDPNFNTFFDRMEVQQKFKQQFDAFYYPKVKSLRFPLGFPHVVGTIGYKLIGDDVYEVTAFTSFKKGFGIKLFDYSAIYMQKYSPLGCKKLRANVIMEHNLVGYYTAKLGFREIDKNEFRKDDADSHGFESDIQFSGTFHVVRLEKILPKIDGCKH